jgi:hypothetical protein
MKANLGSVDRLGRVLLGLALFGLLFEKGGPFRWFGLIGIIPLLTGITSFCPFYSMLGLSSCPHPKEVHLANRRR